MADHPMVMFFLRGSEVVLTVALMVMLVGFVVTRTSYWVIAISAVALLASAAMAFLPFDAVFHQVFVTSLNLTVSTLIAIHAIIQPEVARYLRDVIHWLFRD